jgi:hypothetical protein
MGHGNLFTLLCLSSQPQLYPSCIILTALRSLLLGEIVMHGLGHLRL